MELRHLRCFIVLAEELHFTRAADRLHIEQPPLSRTIKELEDSLGVVLFDRDRRGTQLTAAGAVFLQDIYRLFTVLEQARENVRAVAAGLQGSVRIAVSEGALDQRLSAFLAQCRAEEPEIGIRLSEVSLNEQLRDLRTGDCMIGFSHTADVGEGIVAEPLWHDQLVLALPARHALLAYKAVPVHALSHHPLILYEASVCEGYYCAITQLLRPLGPQTIAEHTTSLDLMLTLVGAGYGVGFMAASKVAVNHRPDVVTRPLAVESATITTYLLRPESDAPSSLMERFVARLRESLDS